MVTVVEVIRLQGDAFAALSLFRLLQWQLTHATGTGIGIGASVRGDNEAPLPTAAMLPVQVTARLAAALAAADDENND